jgi:hypothetical protein
MIALILFLAGIGLCITKHPWWGGLCFAIAVLVIM